MPAVSAFGPNRLGNYQTFTGSNDQLLRNFPAADEHATITVGKWVRPTIATAAGPAESFWQFRSDAGATLHVAVTFTASLQLGVYLGDGTLLGTTDIIWPSTGTTRYIEIQVVLHDTAGSVKIWSDGNQVLNLTGIDTKNGGTKTVLDQFRFHNASAGGQRANPQIDDIYITNGAGAAPYNGNLGDIVVDTLFPNGNGNYSDFLGSDADRVDNFLLVDENPHDGDTSYVESGVDTERDSYGFDDLAYATGAVFGVIATAVVRNLGAADNLQVSTRIAAADYDGATQAAPAGFDASVEERWQQSPATAAAWTIAEVNAAEFGIENVA